MHQFEHYSENIFEVCMLFNFTALQFHVFRMISWDIIWKVCMYNTLLEFTTFVCCRFMYVFRLMHQLGHYLEILRFVHYSTLQL